MKQIFLKFLLAVPIEILCAAAFLGLFVGYLIVKVLL